MPEPEALSQREWEVLELLLQGKSNKEIALALGISVHTVEFHLKNIYRKLNVSSRPGLFARLRRTPGLLAGVRPGDSVVAATWQNGENQIEPRLAAPGWARPAGKAGVLEPIGFLAKAKTWIAITILFAVGLVVMIYLLSPREIYKRECEYPDAATVGRPIYREHASNQQVHGQFGSAPDDPWPAQAGEVIYQYIRLPQLEQVFMKLRYSKNNPSSTPILVYLDDEPTPRASILPADQMDWDKFAWTAPVDLGRIEGGLHSIRFSTQGQQYAVADLDQLILTAKP